MPSIYVGLRVISAVKEEKYLGVIVCGNRKDDKAIQKETRALYYRGNMLYRNFKGCSDDIKIQLFSSHCFSFYCSSLWSIYKRSTIKAIEVAYNNIFRLLFHIPRRVSISAHYVAYGLPCFKNVRRKLIYSIYSRVLSSENELVSTIVNSCFFLSSSIFNEWVNVLF